MIMMLVGYANDEKLGQHYIRLNDSNEWVFKLALLEKGVPFYFWSAWHCAPLDPSGYRLFSTSNEYTPAYVDSLGKSSSSRNFTSVDKALLTPTT